MFQRLDASDRCTDTDDKSGGWRGHGLAGRVDPKGMAIDRSDGTGALRAANSWATGRAAENSASDCMYRFALCMAIVSADEESALRLAWIC
jgi:hypothetical protein